MPDDKPIAPPPFALKELKNALKSQEDVFSQIARSVGNLNSRLGPVDSINESLRVSRPFSTAQPSNVVRFARLKGPGEETIDLHQCLRLLVGICPNSHAPQILDPTTVRVYYLTPDHRGICGMGGLVQVHRGGPGYQEVHPLQIAFDMRRCGMRLPLELERYLPFLDPNLTLNDAISAWERSQSEPAGTRPNRPGKLSDSAAGKNRAPSLDDLTPTAWKLLRTVRQMGAVSADTAKDRSAITSRAKKGNHDSKHNQTAFKRLSDLRFIAARKNVGTWITEAGIDALDKRSTSG
jgi:hypothetical protein